MRKRRCTRVDVNFGKSFHDLKNTDLAHVSEALYIVRPNYLDKYDVKDTVDPLDIGRHEVPVHCCFRCGSVGTKEFVQRLDRTYTGSGERAPSSVYGRMMMYQSNWLTGGKVYAVLALDGKGRNARGQRRRDKNVDGQGYVSWLERQFHQELERNRHVQRLRLKEDEVGNSEWFFADDVMTLISCLTKVAHDENGRPRGTLHLFRDGKDMKGEVLLKKMYTLQERGRTWESMDERQFRGASTRAHP